MTLLTEIPAPVADSAQTERPSVRSTLLSRSLVCVFVSMAAALTNFYLLLSVAPMQVLANEAREGSAGLPTGVLMLSTVIAETFAPSLVSRFGYRNLAVAALLLLGAPSLALSISADMTAVVALSIIRGLGLAITFVIGSAMVASIAPRDRQGEALGLYGAVVGVPAIIALPFGVWLAAHIGFKAVSVFAGLIPLAGLLAAAGLPKSETGSRHSSTSPVALRTQNFVFPALVFGATAVATGAAVTFVPLTQAGAADGLVALSLLLQAVATTCARWWSGRRGDRRGAQHLLLPAILLATLGMFALACSSSAVCLLAGMILLGAGFGIAQNASLALMFERAPPSSYDAASAAWSIAYDSGLGLGAIAFGALASHTGYPIAFVLCGAFVLTALWPLSALRVPCVTEQFDNADA